MADSGAIDPSTGRGIRVNPSTEILRRFPRGCGEPGTHCCLSRRHLVHEGAEVPSLRLLCYQILSSVQHRQAEGHEGTHKSHFSFLFRHITQATGVRAAGSV